ncbi:MAG: hypothetical protein AAF193_07845, partial [Bacteroidota bacterium]
LICTAAFLLMSFTGNTQWSDEVWIIGGPKRISKPQFKKWRFDLQLDGRRSNFQDEPVQMGGIKIGMEHKRVHRFGLGFYGLQSNIQLDQLEDITAPHSGAQVDFNYVTIYYERVVFFNPRWEFSTAFHLGSGSVVVTYEDAVTEDLEVFATYDARPLEASVSGFYHLNYWISLGLGYGYQYNRTEDPTISREYSSDIFIAKAKIRVGKLVRSIFNPKVKNEY